MKTWKLAIHGVLRHPSDKVLLCMAMALLNHTVMGTVKHFFTVRLIRFGPIVLNRHRLVDWTPASKICRAVDLVMC